jgi:ribonucleoside-diphosphate reductase alpha chain
MLAQPITTDVLMEKYAKNSEKTADDIFKRVAMGVAKAEPNKHSERWVKNDLGVFVQKTIHDQDYWSEIFYQNMKRGAVGAGRIMSAAGTDVDATLVNCFTQPVGDSITGFDSEGHIGIYDALTESAETLRRGGGVGYDFSYIRPKNAKVGKVGAMASGPCSYMNIFNSSCETIESAGQRRGAQMGSLRINHPDIEEFIQAKRTPGRWNNFNVSVFVNDEFMIAKNNYQDIELVHKAEPSNLLIEAGAYKRADGLWVYKTVNANVLWNLIMKSNYDFAEPGILFADNINRDNNLNYCEYIRTTNPCGEQPLPDYGCCDLGPIILPKFVGNPFTDKCVFFIEDFKDAVRTHVRFLDNVLDVTLWPLEKQREESSGKRRIGLGFTGLANMLSMMGHAYNSKEGLAFAEFIVKTMRDTAYEASIELAKERGAFPLFDAKKYLKEGSFASRLPKKIKADIRKYGIRNSHLLSVAPVGTVSLAFADNASNGIEPPFSLTYTRKKRLGDGTTQEYPVVDHSLRVYLNTLAEGYRDNVLNAVINHQDTFLFGDKEYKLSSILPKSIVTAMELTPTEHLAMMQAVQPYIDSSISKTVNIPEDYSFDDFKTVYDQAWVGKLKGVATYRPNSILGSVLSIDKPKEAPKVITEERRSSNTDIDPTAILIPKRPLGKLQSITDKIQYYGDNGDYTFYVAVSFMKVNGVRGGKEITMNRPIEIFISVSPSSVPLEWVTVYSRTMSLIARTNLALFVKALQDNRSISAGKYIRYDWHTKEDGTKVPRHHGSDVAVISYAIQQILVEQGILDNNGNIVLSESVDEKTSPKVLVVTKPEVKHLPGKICAECGAAAVIKVDGCDKCMVCGILGSCG